MWNYWVVLERLQLWNLHRIFAQKIWQPVALQLQPSWAYQLLASLWHWGSHLHIRPQSGQGIPFALRLLLKQCPSVGQQNYVLKHEENKYEQHKNTKINMVRRLFIQLTNEMPTNRDGSSSHVLHNTYSKVFICHWMDSCNGSAQKLHQFPEDVKLRLRK